MKKKILVLVVIILLLALTIQVASADPPGPVPQSCKMVNSWWAPLPYGDPPPGNPSPNGVQEMVAEDYNTGELIDGVQQRGMAMAHFNKANPNWPTNGALNMDIICPP